MCGRLAFDVDADELRAAFGAVATPGLPSLARRFNAPPSSLAYAVGFNPVAARRAA